MTEKGIDKYYFELLKQTSEMVYAAGSAEEEEMEHMALGEHHIFNSIRSRDQVFSWAGTFLENED